MQDKKGRTLERMRPSCHSLPTGVTRAVYQHESLTGLLGRRQRLTLHCGDFRVTGETATRSYRAVLSAGGCRCAGFYGLAHDVVLLSTKELPPLT